MPNITGSVLSGIAALAVLVACSAPQASPPPTVAPTIAPVSAPTPPAVTAQTTVSGALDAITGNTLSITTNTGPTDVQLAENAQIDQEGRGSLADLRPGLSVGVTGKPEGTSVTAVSIRIFPPALGTPRPGQFPMSGANQGNLMTNSVVESFDGSNLTVTAAGQRFVIAVPASTQIVKQVPATVADLAPGKRVVASTTPGPGSTLRATAVSIIGGPSQ